jgi:hypothetical protein
MRGVGNIPKFLPIEQGKKDKKARKWGVRLGELCNHPIALWWRLKNAYQVRFSGTLTYLITIDFFTHFQIIIQSI